MKIERLSENQIRCTLNKADLADKELLFTELAYGTDKARELFKELMQRASDELGFEADNTPLMIEAIPVSAECLILIITKVEDPEELDTRFSRFTKPLDDAEDSSFDYDDEDLDDEDDEESGDSGAVQGTEDLIGALGNLVEGLNAFGQRAKPRARVKQESSTSQRDMFMVYTFNSINQIITPAKIVRGIYKSDNSLYKNPRDSRFYLYLTKDKNTEGEFVQTCNVVSEYGDRVPATYATPSHLEEHFKLIIDSNALQSLSEI